MIRAVGDTHAVVWAFLNDARLSAAARAVFVAGTVGVSTISLVEIVYLEEKGRLPTGTMAGIRAALADPTVALEEVPLSAPVVEKLGLVSRSDVPDMPDRIIAATALHLSVPLVTRDRKIRAAGIPSIW